MSKAKMQAARELIQEKRYEEARKILVTLDHPTAREWEAKLNKIAPQKPSKQPMAHGKKLRLYLLIAGLLFLAAVVVFTVIDNQRIANNIAAIKTNAANESLIADREYCLTRYNDNSAAYDQCMRNLGH